MYATSLSPDAEDPQSFLNEPAAEPFVISQVSQRVWSAESPTPNAETETVTELQLPLASDFGLQSTQLIVELLPC